MDDITIDLDEDSFEDEESESGLVSDSQSESELELHSNENKECGICIEPMNTYSFIQPKKDQPIEELEDVLDNEDPKCIRLKCGHAFHFSCQVPAMRMGKFCSLCRDEIKIESGTTRRIQIGNDIWEFSATGTEALGQEIADIMESNQGLLNALNAENNTNYELQSIRFKMNEALHVHRKIANDLKKVRARYIKEALRTFRKEHKLQFDQSVVRIKNILRMTRNLEDSILRRRGFSAREIHQFFASDIQHDLNELISNRAVGGDPARHRFWYH